MSRYLLTLLILSTGFTFSASLPTRATDKNIDQNFELSEKDSVGELGISYKGFIRLDGVYSLRQPVGAREGILYQYPQAVELNDEGQDVNAAPLINMASIFSRGAIRFDGPVVNGVKNYAYVEADFFGHLDNTISNFRLRHAFIHLHDSQFHLTLGQRWSVFTAHQYFPGLINPGAGHPVQPFARHPGIYFDWFPSEQFHFRSSVAMQRDAFAEFGARNDLQQNSGLPIASGSVLWKPVEQVNLGLAAMGKAVRPETTVDNLYSGAVQAFGQWKIIPNLRLRGRAVWGTNMADHQMLGGFVQLNDGSYQALSTTSQWLDLDYDINKQWSVGLFGGFTANLGMLQATGTAQSFSARAPNQAWSAFLVPRLVYQPAEQLRFSLEVNNAQSMYASAYDERLRPQVQAEDRAVYNMHVGLTSMFIF